MKSLLILGAEDVCQDYAKAARMEGCEAIVGGMDRIVMQDDRGDLRLRISASDKASVREAAVHYGVSGILGLGSDEAVTAADTARELGLPGDPYALVRMLHNQLFLREFLVQHQFHVPPYRDITHRTDVEGMSWPLYVSPAEDALARETTLVYNERQLRAAWDRARHYTSSGMVIAQERPHAQIGEDGNPGVYIMTDLVIRDGMLQPVLLSECILDLDCPDPLMAGCRYPARLSVRSRTLLVSECTRLAMLLHLQNAQISIMAYAASGRMPYILAAGPSMAVLRLPIFLSRLYGRDLLRDMVRIAIGEMPENGAYEIPEEGTCMVYYAVRAHCSGTVRRIRFHSELQPYILDWDCRIRRAMRIYMVSERGMDLGRLILRFEDTDTMDQVLGAIDQWIDVEIDAF